MRTLNIDDFLPHLGSLHGLDLLGVRGEPDALPGRVLRDDEAEPDDEDDAEREGDGRQPARQPHAQVQAAHPLGPRSEEGKENAGTRQRTPSGGWAGIATQLDQWNKT